MNRKYRKRKIPRFFFIISLALFLFIGIGYSVINTNLSVQGNVVRKATTWSIGFADPVFDTGSITNPTPTITNGTAMTMNVTLTNPGDIYAFTVDLKNTGTVPALINTLTITQLTEEQQNYLRWKVEYEDESTPETGDVLKAGETKKVHIYLEYKKLRSVDLYPTSAVNLNLSIAVNFNLPEETFSTITLTKNGSTKLIQVSNLEQEVTLNDFPIETTDQVIACNNGVEPSTDTNNKIVLSKVKQNATCRIENSLANAVTNSSTEVTNIAILQDIVTSESTNVTSGQNITIDTNGKNYTVNSVDNNYFIKNYGVTIVKNKKQTGEITSDHGVFYTGSGDNVLLNIRNGTYKRTGNTTYSGVAVLYGGTIIIENSTLYTSNTWTIGVNASINLTIKNSSLQAPNVVIGIQKENNNSITNIINTVLTGNDNLIKPLIDSGNAKVYFCKARFVANNNEIWEENVDNPVSIYFSSDTLFKNNTNEITSNYKRLYKTELACAE